MSALGDSEGIIKGVRRVVVLGDLFGGTGAFEGICVDSRDVDEGIEISLNRVTGWLGGVEHGLGWRNERRLFRCLWK